MIFREKANEDKEGIEDSEMDDGNTQQQQNEARIAELEQNLLEARDQLLRRTAEMENMRRRFNQEREVLIFESNKRLLSDLLAILDDLERTIEHSDAGKEAVLQGMELMHKNFVKLLERYGVQPIQAVGKQFDVHTHDALMQQESKELEPGTVLQEIQKGYSLNDTVLRHAKVIVAKDSE